MKSINKFSAGGPETPASKSGGKSLVVPAPGISISLPLMAAGIFQLAFYDPQAPLNFLKEKITVVPASDRRAFGLQPVVKPNSGGPVGAVRAA